MQQVELLSINYLRRCSRKGNFDEANILSHFFQLRVITDRGRALAGTVNQ